MQSAAGEGSDQNKRSFFTSPFFLSLTVGVPFCIYKVLFGIQFVRAAEIHSQRVFVLAGCILISWAFVDMLINLIRAGYDLIGKADRIECCSLAEIGRFFSAPDVFLAFDTLITFIIICSALWSGWITYLNPVESKLWSFATTVNLISISMVALISEIRRR